MRAVEWSFRAERDLLAMAPSEAEEVMDGVETFARTGQGFLRVMVDGSAEQRLYLARHFAIVELTAISLQVIAVLPR